MSEMERAMTLRLSRELSDRLSLASLASERPVSELVRAAVRAYCAELEDDPQLVARYDELRAALPLPPKPSKEPA